jgi:PAP2 superfamily
VLVVAYPVMTTLVVVATGNHFFLDAVAGTLLACLTWAVVSRGARPSGGQGGGPGEVVAWTDGGDLEEALTRNLVTCLQTSCSGSAARTG